MKRFLGFIIFLSVVLLSGCGSSFEKDVRKIAKMTCETKRLDRASKTDAHAATEVEEARKKLRKFDFEMDKKYNHEGYSWVMDEKTNRIFEEVMKDCK